MRSARARARRNLVVLWLFIAATPIVLMGSMYLVYLAVLSGGD